MADYRWEEGDIALDRTNFVWRRFDAGWRTVPRARGIQYGDAEIEHHLGPLVRLQAIPAEADNLGHVPSAVATRLRSADSHTTGGDSNA